MERPRSSHRLTFSWTAASWCRKTSASFQRRVRRRPRRLSAATLPLFAATRCPEPSRRLFRRQVGVLKDFFKSSFCVIFKSDLPLKRLSNGKSKYAPLLRDLIRDTLSLIEQVFWVQFYFCDLKHFFCWPWFGHRRRRRDSGWSVAGSGFGLHQDRISEDLKKQDLWNMAKHNRHVKIDLW